MIKKIYIIILVLLVLGSLTFLIQFGLKGKAVVKIKWSDFNSSDEVATAISMRLRQEIKDHSIVFLGVEPGNKDHFIIWQKWISLNVEPGWQFDEVLIEPELPFWQEFWPTARPFDIRKNQEAFIEFIHKQVNAKRRVVVILPQVYAAQVLIDNPANRISKESQEKILSITLLALDKTSLPCVAEGADYTGQSALGCLVREKLFFIKNKKNKEQSTWSGMLEQRGLSDFLMYMKSF